MQMEPSIPNPGPLRLRAAQHLQCCRCTCEKVLGDIGIPLWCVGSPWSCFIPRLTPLLLPWCLVVMGQNLSALQVSNV